MANPHITGSTKTTMMNHILNLLFEKRFQAVIKQCIEILPLYFGNLSPQTQFKISRANANPKLQEDLIVAYVLKGSPGRNFDEVHALLMQYEKIEREFNEVRAIITRTMFDCDRPFEVWGLYSFTTNELPKLPGEEDAALQAKLNILREKHKEDLALVKRYVLLNSL